ncbi:MAG: hypothetical protein A2275_10180 [Bacteroidetes bacterium RIFOXYA12_FULL_35_11]|nr:MAG: hypothetical protein A2X01_14130 [Bacteroidetes bacterium GWF2_35_48]OFY76771.1 MAG: hypothetical protein A2275_10180 [Bacteroidetes bacterium RIFOXYA12_FULL_35_11]OFY93426.1 MAG: hypothetical protein A2309_10060 [Bacteroidetes bacterium RIFOXYB2_FULL_35_7]OFZ02273.1 MAG: hypothetical protein A2491_12580 [Bacteroidetes bacterium RIFOXYC12_FULL_35_7]HBX52278.1 hypothetical protein [Bacteroidales bacterium]
MAIKGRIFEGKTLAILTGDGDTPSMNASIEAVKCRASVLGYQVYGVRKGWKGLLGDGDIVDLSNQPYDGWYGGTALRTTRTNPFPTEKNPISRVEEIVRNIKKYKIDVLIIVGGFDCLNVAKKIVEIYGIPIIAIPNTIENNIRTGTIHNYNGQEIESASCPGFPSGAKGIADFTSRVCTTAESHSRIIVLEMLGKSFGWLTGAAMMGGAEIALIPEFPVTKALKIPFFEKVTEVYNKIKKKYLVIAVGEGTKWHEEKSDSIVLCKQYMDTDEFNNLRYGGISSLVAEEIERHTGIQARAQQTAYYSRSGDCRKYDKRLCGLFADKMIDVLLREDYGTLIVVSKLSTYQEIEEYNMGTIPLSTLEPFNVPAQYYDQENFHFNEKYFDFISYYAERPKGIYFNYNFPKVLPK